MKPCDTPLCENMVTRAALCKLCYDRKRTQSPTYRASLKKRMKRYARLPYAREAHRLACQAYRDAGKVEQGECVYCGGATNSVRARRCLACYRARVLPVASKRGLVAIHGRPV